MKRKERRRQLCSYIQNEGDLPNFLLSHGLIRESFRSGISSDGVHDIEAEGASPAMGWPARSAQQNGV